VHLVKTLDNVVHGLRVGPVPGERSRKASAAARAAPRNFRRRSWSAVIGAKPAAGEGRAEGEEAGKARGEVLVHREIHVAHVEGERQDAET